MDYIIQNKLAEVGLILFIVIGIIGMIIITIYVFKQHFHNKDDFMKALKGDKIKR